MDADVQSLYVQFVNLRTNIQIVYVGLAAFLIFVIWQVSTNPTAQINDAVLSGNINVVIKCLEKGIDADIKNGNGVTLLYLAATKNHREIAELLISYGADVNQGLNEEYGRNPLLAAAIENHSELIEMLIANGAKTGLHLATLQGDINIVRTLLGQQIFPINSNRNGGMRPLSLAAMGGHLEVAELLLDKGATLNFLYYREMPLYQAVYFNHLEVVDLLIDRGADPDRACALYIAAHQNHLKIVKRLINRGVNIDYQDHDFKRTPLHAAAEQGLLEMAELLIENGAKVNSKSKSDASTPLHYAAKNGFLEVAKLLISNGSEIDAYGGHYAATPLFYASQEGHLLIVNLLIRNGANVNIPDID